MGQLYPGQQPNPVRRHTIEEAPERPRCISPNSKANSPADLLSYAESLQIENASSLRKQDMMFAILKNLAENDQAIHGEGTLEILSDGFGFLRSPETNYLPGP